ncbi:Hypothetical cytosolic protein [Lacticaseibacillus paracasei]|nr:Hypothetical cytosolic protein [Lacticaseibacillus paracasei]
MTRFGYVNANVKTNVLLTATDLKRKSRAFVGACSQKKEDQS